MKTSLFAVIAFTLIAASAHAGTIKSINDCTIDLYKEDVWNNDSMVVQGSRVTGLKAKNLSEIIRLKGAERSVIVDTLGVKRIETLTLTTVLEKEGDDRDICKGVTTANEVKICTQTTDLTQPVCETRCEFKWVGADCR